MCLFNYHFCNGNRKLGKGILHFDKLHGDWARKVLVQAMNGETILLSVKGSCKNCKECKKKCYCEKSERQYANTLTYRAINTYGIQKEPDEVFKKLYHQLFLREDVKAVRINSSGELTSKDEFLNWCKLAEEHTKITFYLYTKMFEYVEGLLLERKVPKNMVVIYSLWGNTGVREYDRVKHLKNVKAFVYDDGNCPVKTKTRCMAYENGKKLGDLTCDQCKLCFSGNVKVIACKPH